MLYVYILDMRQSMVALGIKQPKSISMKTQNILTIGKYKYFGTKPGLKSINVHGYVRNNILSTFILINLLNEC